MTEPNPYKAPDPTGLRTTRPGALNPLQHLGVYVLAVLVIVGFMAIRVGFRVFNAWLLPDSQRLTPSQQIEEMREFLENEKQKAQQQREE
jgi:hypothetical protein